MMAVTLWDFYTHYSFKIFRTLHVQLPLCHSSTSLKIQLDVTRQACIVFYSREEILVCELTIGIVNNIRRSIVVGLSYYEIYTCIVV
jgi:hypothetical protein